MEFKYKSLVRIKKGFYEGQIGHIVNGEDQRVPGAAVIWRYTVEIDDDFKMRALIKADDLEPVK